ncbi:hypothetical protein [Flavobacterium sp. 1355]|uniref:hypothetical protein n=1 Tax=Flavobacterium sp. 1355 TaxID=2806571 RepID=UPI001AEB1B78|nr:hypothetical protein [Flavobacterium sp. 1355]MBP1222905.1 hypothetical protein [Flavobacterium sp. 1355]
MNAKDINDINLSLAVHGLRIKALESCLTDDQRKVFEASLLESKNGLRKQLELALGSKPQRLAEVLKQLGIQ